MFQMTFGAYRFSFADGYPALYGEYCKHAALAEFFRCEHDFRSVGVVTVARGDDWPFLVIAQEYSPNAESGFLPGMAFVLETRLLFLGAGTRILIYNVETLEKIGEEYIPVGFWGWRCSGEYVLMSSELTLVAWDISGKERWSCFVEPPWTYTLKDERVYLDVMGKKTSFLLKDGPELPG